MVTNGLELQQIRHLSLLSECYSVFAFPILGILHDGNSLNSQAFSCLKKLSDHGKTVVILSNVPKRRHALIQDLASIGVPPSLYQHIITSGEETFHALQDRKDSFHAALGRKCYVIGSSETFPLLEKLTLTRVPFIDEAEFILALSLDEWHKDLDFYKPILEEGARLGLPLVCANPNLYGGYQEGDKSMGVGTLAAYYETLGGAVAYHGKPYKPFYKSLLKDLAPFQKKDVLILGNSLSIDIKGASKTGIDSLLCMTDTTLIELDIAPEYSQNINQAPFQILKEKLNSFGIVPTYITQQLCW